MSVSAWLPLFPDARCADQPELMFDGDPEQAKALCRRCDHMVACAEWATGHAEPEGIWGATAPEDRIPRRSKCGRGHRLTDATTRMHEGRWECLLCRRGYDRRTA